MDVSNLTFDCKVILGKADLPAACYHGLQLGDIVLLDQKASNPLSIIIGEERQFEGSPGLDGIHKAVKIGRST